MAKVIDLAGQKFNFLTFKEHIGGSKWVCICECGNETTVFNSNVTRGLTKSCGCYNKQSLRDRWENHTPPSKEQVKARYLAWHEKNKETQLKRKQIYRDENKKILSEGKRRCYQAKRDQYLSRVKENYAKDPEAYITRERLKATLKKEATPPWADQTAIKDFYRECRRVSKETGVLHHVDHIIPLRSDLVCGLHCDANLQIIPASENWKKHNSFDQDQK